MLDLAALKAALEPIAKVGRDELTFEVEGNTLTLRPLLPREEVEAQRFAQESIKAHQDAEGNTDRYAVMSYFDTFQAVVLSYSIIEINGLDLREEEYIATGETTQSGKPVRVPRHVAIRKMTLDWSRALLTGAWAKYTELLTSIEEKAANLVEYTPSDLDAEIDRVEKRLAELKAERERRTKSDSNLFMDQVKAINDLGQQRTPGRPTKAPEAPAKAPPTPEPPHQSEAPMEATTASREEEWATFDDLPSRSDLNDLPSEEPEPQEEPDLEDLAAAAAAAQPMPRRPVVPPSSPPPSRGRPVDQPVDPMPDIMDSFGDVDDNAVLAAEEARILAARQKAAREREQAVATGRVPPHRRGYHPSDEELQPGLSGGEFRAATPEELAARGVPPHLARPQDPTRTHVPGRDAEVSMAREPEVLSNRGRERARANTEGVKVNSRGDTGAAQNKNFRGPAR